MVRESHFESGDDLRRYETLLQMADLVVHRRSLPELLPELAQRLHQVASFEVANFSLYDPARNVMRMHLWEGNELLSNLTELQVEEAACSVALEKQEPVVWPDLGTEIRFERTVNLLKERGIRSYCTLPLTSAQRRLGVMGLGSSQVDVYTESDVRLLSRVAQLMALALDNAMTRAALDEEKERLEALLQVSTSLVSTLDVQKIFPAISGVIRRVFRHDYASLIVHDEGTHELRKYALDSPFSAALISPEPVSCLQESATGRAFLEREVKIYSREGLAGIRSSFVGRLRDHGIQSLCCLPLMSRRGAIGTLNLASTGARSFLPEDISFLKQVAAQVAAALENARAYREIAELTEKLKKEKLYLEDEIRSVVNFEEIVGESPALKKVLTQVHTVAPSDATVLILGETGTGKELIARAIHRMSTRKDASFIKLNCAAIPTGLLESELFGHEKGAFTGAVSQKIGRLELADHGTLFLDEVGDIPLELQPKLLRVLQDQEFERLGGDANHQGEHSVDCRHQSRSGQEHGREHVSQRSFLPASRLSSSHAPVAGTRHRHSVTGALLRAEVCPPHEQTDRYHSHGGHECLDEMAVARQCEGVGELHRAIGDSLGRARAKSPFGRAEVGFGCFSTRVRSGVLGTGIHSKSATRDRGSHRRRKRSGRTPGHETDHSPIKDSKNGYYAARISELNL